MKGLTHWEVALSTGVLVKITLAEFFLVHLNMQATGTSKVLNSPRLILLSRSNIDMLLFSIFILPPARNE